MRKDIDAGKAPDKVTRRSFIKGAAAAGAGVALGATGCGKASHAAVPNASLPTGKSKVVIIREQKAPDNDELVADMLDRAMLELTGKSESKAAWSEFITPEDVVGVKINLMMTPTSPAISRAVVSGVNSVGVAEKDIIVWDRNEAGRGLEGSRVRNEKPGFDSKSLSKVVTDEATALINVPGLKVHFLAGVAIALKNWIGAVTNINLPDVGVAYSIHGDSCAECCMVNAIPSVRDKCRLIVVDATRPLFNGGPQVNPQYLWPYNGIIVGTDPVAVDAVGIAILKAKRNAHKGADWPISPPPKHVYVAEEKYKLGHSNLENIEIVKLGWQEESLI
jgi:hypothetical protein